MDSSDVLEDDCMVASSKADAERAGAVKRAHPFFRGSSDPVDLLTDSMSSLSLIPPAIQFGRGGLKTGFQRHSNGSSVHGSNKHTSH